MLALLPAEAMLFAFTIVVTAAATPLAMRAALRLGIVDRPAPHKFHQRTTPYLGGVAIGSSVLIALILMVAFVPERRLQVATIALAGLAVAAVGLLDDWITLRAFPRLAVQIAAALGLWASGVTVSATGIALIDLPIMVFVVLAVTNAINLIDNMDGISTGTVAIASLFFFLAAWSSGQRLVPIVALVLAGACLGFLPFNFSPARIFLGDAGTLFMGFIVAVLALKLELPGYPAITRFAVPALILAVPVLDMTLVVLSRWRAGRPVFLGGTDHTSHRLVSAGATPRLAALITYAAAAITGTIALLLLETRNSGTTWAVLVAAAFVGGVLLWTFERVPVGTSSQAEPSQQETSRGPRTRRQPVIVSSELVPSGTLPRH